jgi:tRNA pseudouridine55 synthase
MTSHDVVAKLRRIVGTRKVGHAGTLDPMATGVLVVGVEKATRLLHYVSGTVKEYRATIRLGQTTHTDDAEGELRATVDAGHLTPEQIAAAMAPFVGEIAQVPSSVSAIKQDGKRAYERVRAGESVTLPPRHVTITRFEAMELRREGQLFDVDVAVECSSGTYVRALARDVGAALGVGGHLTALRRTRVGGFDINDALTLEQLAQAPEPVTLGLSDAVSAQFPRRELNSEQTAKLRHGVAVEPAGITGTYGAFDSSGHVIALLDELRPGESEARPVVVFSAA